MSDHEPGSPPEAVGAASLPQEGDRAPGDGTRCGATEREPDYKRLFEASPGLHLVLDPELRVVAATDAYLEATLTRREEIVGRHIFDVFPDNPDDPSADSVRNSLASFNRVVQRRVADVIGLQRHDVRRPESEGGGFAVRYWSAANFPLLDADGALAYIMHRVEDVTGFVLLKQKGVEQDRLTEQLRQQAVRMDADIYARQREVNEASMKLKLANEELERLYAKTRELDELKSRFFANLSHELRTPLTLVLGPVRALRGAPNLDDNQRRDLAVVERNARTLVRMVNDLLDLSKLDAGRMEADYAEVDLASLGRWVASHFETIGEERRIRFAVEAPASLEGEVDAEKIERVLFNLLSNAFKFTPAGGAVRLGIAKQDDQVELVVEDSGPGIPAAMREAIFERFRQVDAGATRGHGGTGLGLSIVKEFVGLHGGAVRVSEGAQGGARFTVRLPLHPPGRAEASRGRAFEGSPRGATGGSSQSANVRRPRRPSEELARTAVADLRIEAGARPVASPSPASQGGTVLVVEDNPEMRAFLERALGAHHRVLLAADGQEGLEQVRALGPDLVVTDLMMPRLTGDEMVRAIRGDRQLDEIPILMLTAKADDRTRVELLESGVQDYLVKPFVAEELVARANGLVERKRRAARQLREDLERQVEQRTAELASANRELEAFVYTVSHDLRAPLRHIESFAGLLERRAGDALDAKSHEYLGHVVAAGRRMGSLITDLLALSRLGRAPMVERSVDLGRLVEEVRAELGPQMEGRAIRLEIGALPVVHGDPTLLRSALLNLLSNAVKYTRTRDEAVIEIGRVVVAGDDDDDDQAQGAVTCFVRDNGVGFDPRLGDRLFGLFQRLHPTHKFEGTGVGLACVRRAVERHGGRVWAEGDVDRGACFFFSLPPDRIVRDVRDVGDVRDVRVLGASRRRA